MNAPITVLVVEDEPLILMNIAKELVARGFRIIEANNADEAIDLLVAHPEIEILFTDVDMPGSMNGLKLAVAVRGRWPPVKIIITSGHCKIPMADMPDESRFFSKPYRADAVATSIHEMISE